ncbi:MAG: alpha/beta hydrolase [Pseudomonadota bacterium]
MPTFVRDDVTLHYEIEGSGPPLLLLAGMLSDSATWAAIVPLLSNRFTVIRPDNRTTGRTVPWNAPADGARMAEDAAALMVHLRYDRFHVAGHSLGGLLAMEIACAQPSCVASLSVLASSWTPSPRTIAVFDALLAVRSAPAGEELWLRVLYPWIFGPAFFEAPENANAALEAALAYPHAQSHAAMAHQISAFKAFKPKATPEMILCPTLVIYAGQDILAPPDEARRHFARIAKLAEVTVEGAGHAVMWDAPDTTARCIAEFITDALTKKDP